MKVSFVIPVGKSTKYLGRLLDSIHTQDYPDTEVLIEPWGTIGQARQWGVDRATGDLIAFVDSDCVLPNPDWLNKMVAPFSSEGVVLTWTLGAYHDDDPWIMKYSIDSRPYLPGMIPGTGHTLIRRQAILDAGGFRDLRACEDKDLIRRLKGEFVYVPDARVYHYHATTIRQFLYKKFRNTWYCLRLKWS